MNNTYSWKKGLIKLVEFLVIASPIIIQALPETWQNITLAGALRLGVNYLKVKYL